jgi:hypothetical protein
VSTRGSNNTESIDPRTPAGFRQHGKYLPEHGADWPLLAIFDFSRQPNGPTIFPVHRFVAQLPNDHNSQRATNGLNQLFSTAHYNLQ